MPSPRTIEGEVTGTGVVTYRLPPGVFQYVQAIRVGVDNTAGADTQPSLEIAEQTGVVIADAPQAGTIPAGGTGSATWALRLTDDTAATPSAGSSLIYAFTVTNPQTTIDTTADGPMAGLFPQDRSLLRVYAYLRSDFAGLDIGAALRFNGDNGNHYWFIFTNAQQQGAGAPATALGTNGAAAGPPTSMSIPAATADAGFFGTRRVEIPEYANTVGHKTYTQTDVEVPGSAGFRLRQLRSWGAAWSPAVPVGIDHFTLVCGGGANFVVGSTLLVYAE